MSFDALKTYAGRTYGGMRIGGRNQWRSPECIGDEQKTGPDDRRPSFRSTKRRTHAAPMGSGAGIWTEYHGFLIAHQHVRKVDADSYETLMQGVKHQVAPRRPYWRRWSCGYPDQEPAQERAARILRDALRRVEASALPSPQGSGAAVV